MSKEVQVVTRCDGCGSTDDVDTYPEVNSSGKPVEIDLDAPCKARFDDLKAQAALILTPFTDLIDEHGAKPTKASKPKTRPASKKVVGERVCLMCTETMASDTGILGHMQKEHGLPRSMPEIFGNICPLDAEEYPRLAQHVAQAHKEHTHVSQAFAFAKANGDPHKVVASRIAKLQKKAKAA